MPGLAPIQQKFLALLQGTINFFATPQPQSVQDRKMVEQLRTDALRLAEESSQPAFEPFLAYLLGASGIEAHYPLQTIRLLCIVARATHITPGLTKPQIDELLTAAYFCDIGFRAAWLGQKGTHAELTAYRLKEMQFAWFTPSLEKMILYHHEIAQDISPHHLISMAANYLALVYGLGVDVPPNTILSPVKALEALIEEFPTETDGIHYLLRTLSAYPLGSWVQMNTSQVGLVVGSNAANPLRPRIGYAGSTSPQGPWRWEEHSLQTEMRVNLQRELLPNAAQAHFLNLPHLWIPTWQSQGAFTKEEYVAAFGELLSTEGSVASPIALQNFLGNPEQKPIVSGDAPKRTNGISVIPVTSIVNPLPHPLVGQETELQNLRADWEKHVHLIEESVNHLRHGLIDSYRRENDEVRKAMTEMIKNQPVTSSPHSATALIEMIEHVLIPLEDMIPVEEKHLREEHAALEEVYQRVRTALTTLPNGPPQNPRIKELTLRWQSEWEAVAAQLIDPLHPLPEVFLNLKTHCAAARAFLTRLQRLPPKSDSSSTARWQVLWEGRHRPILEKSKTLAEEARHEQSRCIERVQRLAERYLEQTNHVIDPA